MHNGLTSGAATYAIRDMAKRSGTLHNTRHARDSFDAEHLSQQTKGLDIFRDTRDSCAFDPTAKHAIRDCCNQLQGPWSMTEVRQYLSNT